MAEHDQVGVNYDKIIIYSDCNKIKRLPNVLKKLIGGISYLTLNAKEVLIKLSQAFI